MKSYKLPLILFLLSLLLGFIFTMGVMLLTGDNPPGGGNENPDGSDPKLPPPPPKVEKVMPEVTKITGKPYVVVTNSNYSYSLILKNLPKDGGEYKYELTDGNNTYVTTTNKFTKVKANSTGKYNLTIIDIPTGTRSNSKEIRGFVIKKPITKITASRINSLVATGDYEKNGGAIKAKMARGCKITRSGSKTTLQNIFISAGMGASMRVTKIEYNFLGQATIINFN